MDRSSVKSMSATVEDKIRQNPGKFSSLNVETSRDKFSLEAYREISKK